MPYRLEVAPDGQDTSALQAFHKKIGSPIFRYTTVHDGDLILHESGAITEYVIVVVHAFATTYMLLTRYLCETYDPERRLIPQTFFLRARTHIFIHAAEGTLASHAMAFSAFRMGMPQQLRDSAPHAVANSESKMAVHVQKDLDWLERKLGTSTGAFFVGDNVTAADIMLHISVSLTLKYELGTQGKSWPKLEAWLGRCEETNSCKRAVERSGFHL